MTNSSSPVVSVIVAAYNAGSYIARCLDSIAGQTFKDFDVIIVDDGSTDDSGTICAGYTQKDPRFRVITKENGGVSSARNSGLEQVHGKWVTFVDADDILPENALEILLKKATDKDFDLVFAGYEVYDEHFTKSYQVQERIDEVLDRDHAISLLYKPKYYRYLGYVWGKLYKSDIIRNHHLQFSPDITFNEDRLFVTDYLAHCTRIRFTTEPVYNYYEHSASAMASLEIGFNPKFLTDLDAMIRMRRIVANYSQANLDNAVKGIASSYWRIQGMMNSFHANTAKRILSLHGKLLRNLSLKDYCELIIGTFFKKIYRKLAHA